MNMQKNENINITRILLNEAGLEWQEFSNYHWRVNEIDVWPSTQKWLCPGTGEIQYGIKSLITYLRPKNTNIKYFTVEEMFTIARKVTPMNLEAICKKLHESIYKKGDQDAHNTLQKQRTDGHKI